MERALESELQHLKRSVYNKAFFSNDTQVIKHEVQTDVHVTLPDMTIHINI